MLNNAKLNLVPPVGKRCGGISKSREEEGNHFLLSLLLCLN